MYTQRKSLFNVNIPIDLLLLSYSKHTDIHTRARTHAYAHNEHINELSTASQRFFSIVDEA